MNTFLVGERDSSKKTQISDNQRNYESPDSRQKSSRGRGRGQKVFVQSEGTFLGEGPALKTKKEVPTSSYERSSGPRGSRSKEADCKFDANAKSLKYLFENYDEDEVFDENLILPVRFPIVKQEVKKEIKEEVKIEIKEEILDEDIKEDIEIVIKKEPIDPSEAEGAVTEQLEKVDISDKEKSCGLGEELKFIKGEGTLLLFQLPSFLPFKKAPVVVPEINLKSLGEGRIGKLQIFRSGKMRLVTGSMTMSVETTSEIQTLCEIASVSVGNSRENGDIAVLGRINQKLVLRPFLEEDMNRMRG
ncbi:hypothetical protein JTE90_003543 [Oedothorax gibbosus]|uniref:DNA-directed RNA polymerase III subunit RPC4 n=1 Tax=Oedothorax gibbosus TaxID=931172 RepID=A0AAV6VJ56_9ARAC|nr:hypothetical protein JTE90_003543 [Oedothorax gibbosus]